MTITEILIFAKILAAISGDRTVAVTDLEKKIAADALKRIADQRIDWTQQQKAQYKTLVDVVERLGYQSLFLDLDEDAIKEMDIVFGPRMTESEELLVQTFLKEYGLSGRKSGLRIQ